MSEQTDKYEDLYNLPHPEDIASENEYELVGLYLKVYAAYVKISTYVTEQNASILQSGVLGGEFAQVLGRVVETREAPLERWMNQADDYMPEWFNRKLLDYPTEKAQS